MNKMKENWLKTDEVCPTCNQVTKKVRGITKQNFRTLLIPKWSWDEFLITLMLVFIILLAFAYRAETQQSREWIESMTGGDEETCNMNCNQQCHANFELQNEMRWRSGGLAPLPNLTMTNETIPNR